MEIKSATWFMLSHAASMASVELICVNPKLGQRELTHTLANIPATAVFTESAFISRLLTPLVECPHVRLIVYDTSSEVDADLDEIKREVRSLAIGLGGRTKIISTDELCKIGLEVLENFSLDMPTEKDKIWGHLYARTLNEHALPTPDSLTNAQVIAEGLCLGSRWQGSAS